MPKKEGFKTNLDSIWKEGKGKPGGRVEKGLAELFEKDSIGKNLALGLIEGVQWTEAKPAKLHDHLDKAEESLNKLPHSENVTHLKSYLAQIREHLDEAKISGGKLTPEQRKFYNKVDDALYVVQMKAAQKAAGVQGWEFGSGVYDEDALRKVSNRIDTLEKRIQKASAKAGGKKSASKRKKNRDTKP